MTIRFECLYEFVGPEGPLPNGIDITERHTSELLKLSNYTWHGGPNSLFTLHKKKYGVDVPVFVTGLPIDDNKYHKTTILGYSTNTRPRRNDRIYIYSINVFGNIDNATGVNTPLKKTAIQNINKLTVDRINQEPNFFLFINHTEEGEFRKENILNIYNDLTSKKINLNKVIFGTSCYNADSVISNILNEIGVSDKLNVLKHNWALRSCSKHWWNVLNDDKNKYKFYDDINHYETIVTDSDNINQKRNKKFLSLNYRIRDQRLLFFGIMNKLGILNSNDISYDLLDENLEYLSDILKGKFQENDAEQVNQYWYDAVIGNLNDINPKKQVVDIENIKDARGHGWERKDTYLNSYINITTESLFFEDCWYMSEKIFKPIANLQPFIIIGSPQTLKTLKQLGFETFSDFWDESYDEETDPLKRIEKIYKLLEYLNNLSMDEIHNIYQKSIPILKHNQQKLLNYRHHHLMDVSFFKYFEGLLVGRTLQKHLN